MPTAFTFELLCVDTKKVSKIQTADQLIYSLMSNSELLKSPQHNAKQHRIDDGNLNLFVTPITVENTVDFIPLKAFKLTASGSLETLGNLRLHLVAHIKKQDIDLIYILLDEVSEKIAQDIYPLINQLENRLRRYVIKFFVTRLGPDWWNLTADDDMRKKAQINKSNEKVFVNYIDKQVYLIDFGDLGEIVYTQSSGFINRQDIINKINCLEPTPEAVTHLKQDIQSNYNKFFKETFKDKNFQDKWERLEKIRHKVAHNNLFVISDQEEAIQLSKDLMAIIEEAEQKIDTIVFSQSEQEAIQEKVIDSLIQERKRNPPYPEIDEDELLEQLEKQEDFSQERGGFVGLSHFVKVNLGYLGYDYSSSYKLIDELQQHGVIEVYDESSAFGYTVKAIRRVMKNEG